MNKLSFATVCIAVSLLAGCVSSAGIKHDQTMHDGKSYGAVGQFAEWPAKNWWQQFNDPELNKLIESTLHDSPSMVQAAKKVAQANAYVGQAHATLSPQVNGSADITRQRLSENSFYPPPFAGSQQTIANASLNASWDLDFWNKNRAGLNAALSQVEAAKAEEAAAHLLLSANVAQTYYQLATLLAQKDIALQEVKQREHMLQLIKQRVDIGLDTDVELRQGEGALPEARAAVEAIDESIALTQNALVALVAQPAENLRKLQPRLPAQNITVTPENVPADLLGRRPDLSAARYRAEAASSEIASTKAEFYPNISLTAFLGLSSFGLSRFLDVGSTVAGVGPAIHLPIFDAGALRAKLQGKNADLDLAIASYNQVLLDAIHDVADQISSMHSVDKQAKEQVQAQTAAESAYQLATLRYEGGLSTYLTVLSAEDNVLRARQRLIELHGRQVGLNIAMIKALGGGFQNTATQNLSKNFD